MMTFLAAGGLAVAMPALAGDSKDASANQQADKERDTLTFVEAQTQYGFDVRGSDDEKLGDISDIAFDLEAANITHLLIDTGGFLSLGEEVRAIPSDAVTWKNGRYTASISKEEFQEIEPLPEDHARFFSDPQNLEELAEQFDDVDRAPSGDITLASTLTDSDAQLNDGDYLGQIRDFAIDLETGTVGYAMIQPLEVALEGIGSPDRIRFYALPISAITQVRDDGQLRFDLGLDEVRDADVVRGMQEVKIDSGARGTVYTVAVN